MVKNNNDFKLKARQSVRRAFILETIKIYYLI